MYAVWSNINKKQYLLTNKLWYRAMRAVSASVQWNWITRMCDYEQHACLFYRWFFNEFNSTSKLIPIVITLITSINWIHAIWLLFAIMFATNYLTDCLFLKAIKQLKTKHTNNSKPVQAHSWKSFHINFNNVGVNMFFWQCAIMDF